jgi:hypothetical protein
LYFNTVRIHQTVQWKVWCMVPFGKDQFSRVKGLGKDKGVYINSLKYIALRLASIIVNELNEENPTAFPPSPTHLALGDNTPSLSWFDHHSTASAMGQNQIRLSAEDSTDANVKLSRKHLKGTLNTMANEIFASPRTFHPTSNNNPRHPFLYTYKTGLSEASNSTIGFSS